MINRVQRVKLYIVLFLHQTTTYPLPISKYHSLYIVLFLHQTITWRAAILIFSMLYIVLFLHQTTTEHPELHFPLWLYIVLFLHQTTTWVYHVGIILRCISYYSYIKPQHNDIFISGQKVVYRTIPTSNHNLFDVWTKYTQLYIVLFLHQTTTVTQSLSVRRCCISYYSYIKPQLQYSCIK